MSLLIHIEHWSQLHNISHMFKTWLTKTQLNADSSTAFRYSQNTLTTYSRSREKLHKGRQKTMTKMSSTTFSKHRKQQSASPIYFLTYHPYLFLSVSPKPSERERDRYRERDPYNKRSRQYIKREWWLFKKRETSLWYSCTLNEIVVLKCIYVSNDVACWYRSGNVTTRHPLVLFPSNHYNGREGFQVYKISSAQPYVT